MSPRMIDKITQKHSYIVHTYIYMYIHMYVCRQTCIFRRVLDEMQMDLSWDSQIYLIVSYHLQSIAGC